MQRPGSIIMFERLYGASIVVGLVNSAVGWRARQAVLDANPVITANPDLRSTLVWMVPLLLLIGLSVSLLLWFFIARRGSVVAKWIMTVLTGLGVLGSLGAVVTLVRGLSPSVLTSLLGLIATALSVAAAAMLFRPDALPWFGEERDEDLTETFR